MTIQPARLVFRSARHDDLPFIVALMAIDDVGVPVDDPADAHAPHYRAALDAIDADPNQMMVVAEENGEPAGILQLTFIPGIMRRGMRRGLIENVHIAPEKRSRGLGSEMIRWAVDACKAQNCGLVQLTSNKKRVDAHRFYLALGFAQSHEGFKLFL